MAKENSLIRIEDIYFKEKNKSKREIIMEKENELTTIQESMKTIEKELRNEASALAKQLVMLRIEGSSHMGGKIRSIFCWILK